MCLYISTWFSLGATLPGMKASALTKGMGYTRCVLRSPCIWGTVCNWKEAGKWLLSFRNDISHSYRKSRQMLLMSMYIVYSSVEGCLCPLPFYLSLQWWLNKFSRRFECHSLINSQCENLWFICKKLKWI